jgi:release factor glutamine methyltransferase
MHFLDTDRAGLYARAEGLDTRTARLFGRALCQRCGGVPLQHLTGTQDFMGLRLQTRPGVFIPRPETEVLVEAALEALAARSRPVVVDVGAGTGAVALAIKHERRDARVVATDVSGAAVELTSGNAAALGLEVEVLKGDLLEPVPGSLRGRLDLVVSNPPYIDREDYEGLPDEVKADPYEALVGGTRFHLRLVEDAVGWLAPEGTLAVEIGMDQGREVASAFVPGFEAVRVLHDLAGRDRVVVGRLSSELGVDQDLGRTGHRSG